MSSTDSRVTDHRAPTSPPTRPTRRSESTRRHVVAALDRRADRAGADRRRARSGRQRRPVGRDSRARLARGRGRLGRARGPVRRVDPGRANRRGRRRATVGVRRCRRRPRSTTKSSTRRRARTQSRPAHASHHLPTPWPVGPFARARRSQRLAGATDRRRPGGSSSRVFLAGTLPVAVMVLVVLALAGAEAYAGFRSAGAHPATVLGIVAMLTLGVAVYNKGLARSARVTVLLVIFGFVWYLNAPSADRRARRAGRDDLRLRLDRRPRFLRAAARRRRAPSRTATDWLTSSARWC